MAETFVSIAAYTGLSGDTSGSSLDFEPVCEYTGLGIGVGTDLGIGEVGTEGLPVGPYTGFNTGGPLALKVAFFADWTVSYVGTGVVTLTPIRCCCGSS